MRGLSDKYIPRKGGGFVRLYAIMIICISVFFISPPKAMAQDGVISGLKSKIMRAATSVKNVGSFTISKIEPRTIENIVCIYFADICSMQEIHRDFKLLPPAHIEWYESGISGKDNVLTLKGWSKPGRQYIVILPHDFKSINGRTYAKGVKSFTMPGRDPDISFLQQGSVIERNSRQMLLVQIMNVKGLRFLGLKIPPILALYASRMT